MICQKEVAGSVNTRQRLQLWGHSAATAGGCPVSLRSSLRDYIVESSAGRPDLLLLGLRCSGTILRRVIP